MQISVENSHLVIISQRNQWKQNILIKFPLKMVYIHDSITKGNIAFTRIQKFHQKFNINVNKIILIIPCNYFPWSICLLIQLKCVHILGCCFLIAFRLLILFQNMVITFLENLVLTYFQYFRHIFFRTCRSMISTKTEIS